MEGLQNSSAGIESSIWKFKGYNELIDDWFLMASPVPVVGISVAYLLFVLKMGPDYMQKRQPLTLNNILLVYNFAQVAVSFFILFVGIRLLAPNGIVASVCTLDKEQIVPLATGIYYYFAAKVSELLDTVFFVLRKKNNQVSFLHVYHHTLMLLSTWYTLKYEPTYTVVFLGTLNSFIHVVMYSYYALSTFPSLAKYLWWKKYITSMQLIQFLCIIMQVSANYYVSGCPPSSVFLSFILFNACLMIYLFGDFYYKAYTKNNERKKSKKEIEVTPNVKPEKNFVQGLQTMCSLPMERLHEKSL